MKLNRRIIYVCEGILVLFAVWAVLGIYQNSQRITSITVTLNPYGIEHRDNSLGELGKADVAPDYCLRYRSKQGWVELGTYANTWILNGLVFKPATAIPRKEVMEFQLIDDDPHRDDVLEQFPLKKDFHEGMNYTIQITREMSLEAGFNWFFKTPVGTVIWAGFSLAMVISFLGYMPVFLIN